MRAANVVINDLSDAGTAGTVFDSKEKADACLQELPEGVPDVRHDGCHAQSSRWARPASIASSIISMRASLASR
jgi:hypothetical protein